MKRLTTLLTALSLTFSVLGAGERMTTFEIRKPRNKQRTAQTAEPTAAPSAKVEAAPVEPVTERSETAAEPYNPVLNIEWTPAQLDSLVAVWSEESRERAFGSFYENFISLDGKEIEDPTKTPDEVYAARLRALVSPVQLPYNPVVRNYIVRYTDRRYKTVDRLLALAKYYFPIFEEELLREGLPVELRVLPIIESALVPTAVSRSGAAGLWQFMPSTGRQFNLEINSLIDERLDPVLSTRAACRYLRDLYSMYNDWALALAAYNCGPGNVNKALARAGADCKTFWDIYFYLPAETRGYVPAFIGATYACAYHRVHGAEVDAAPIPMATDTVTVNRIMHLGQVSSTIDLPLDLLRRLNPQYKLDIVPATTKSYPLVLPMQFLSQYIDREQEIMAKDSTFLKEYIDPANIDRKRLERGITYTVRSGDTLSGIAARHHVTVREIMKWNNLKSDRLRIGQRLRLERAR